VGEGRKPNGRKSLAMATSADFPGTEIEHFDSEASERLAARMSAVFLAAGDNFAVKLLVEASHALEPQSERDDGGQAHYRWRIFVPLALYIEYKKQEGQRDKRGNENDFVTRALRYGSPLLDGVREIVVQPQAVPEEKDWRSKYRPARTLSDDVVAAARWLDRAAERRRLSVLAVLVGITIAASGALYVASGRPPFGFYYDLGGDIYATSLISSWIQGVRDLVDSIGWAGWGNVSQFPFHPMLSYLARVPLVHAFNDVVTTVKFFQFLEVPFAIISMACLYALLRGWSVWAWIAGLIYALLPETLMMIRGNVDFGMAVALAPLCVAVPFALARRFGYWALPLCGAVAGLLSFYLSLEFLFLQGIPAYALAAAVAYNRNRRAAWAALAIIGFICLGFSGAYFLIPSLAMSSLFTFPFPAIANLQSGQGGGFAMFGEKSVAALALVINEFVGARPEFSVEPLLWLIVPLGLALWVAAIWRVVWAPASGRLTRGELAIAVTGGICAVLAAGSSLPAANIVWTVIAHIPGLNLMRTPDRLMSFAIVIVVLFGVAGFERLSTISFAGRRLAFAAAAIYCMAGLFFLFSLRLFFGDPASLGDRFPRLDAVNAVALKEGGRAADLGETYRGATGDTPLYGMGVPFNAFQQDFFQRYEADGFGGAAILARAGVRTFITTPPWALDSPYYADTIAHADILKLATPIIANGDPAGLTAAYVTSNPRGVATPVTTICIQGGPGLFEYALAAPQFTHAAFVTDSAGCRYTVYTNSAPTEPVLRGRIVTALSGIDLFPHGGQMRDNDYRIALGRWFINFPWYRNSLDGDSPMLSSAAVSLDPNDAARASFELKQPGHYAIALRMLCHVVASGTVSIDATRRGFTCSPALGFQWIEIDAGRLGGGRHVLDIAMANLGTKRVITTAWNASWRLGFDGAAIVSRDVSVPVPAGAYLFSTDRFASVPIGAPVSPAAISAAARINLFQNASFTGGSGTGGRTAPTNMDGTYSSGVVPKFWSPYNSANPAGGAAARYALDRSAGAPNGIATEILLPYGNQPGQSVGLEAGGAGRNTDNAAPIILKANTLYTVAFYAKASAPNTDFSTVSPGGVTVTPKAGFPTSYPDTNWHRYSFEWLVGPSDVNTGIWLRTDSAFSALAPPAQLTATPRAGGGTLAAGVYRYEMTALTANGQTVAGTEVPVEATTSNSSIGLTWTPVSGAVSYAVYRTAPGGEPGSELALVKVAAYSYTDAGNLTPHGGGPPRINTTGRKATVWFAAPRLTVRPSQARDFRSVRWLAAGTYHVATFLVGGAPGAGVVIDGARENRRGDVKIRRSGMHTISYLGPPQNAYAVAFVPSAWNGQLQSNATVRVDQLTSQRWRVTVDRPTTVEASVFPDGWWRLKGSSAALTGSRCDIVNTCFQNVPSGKYMLMHRWPNYIKLGFACTIAAWIVALLAFRLGRRGEGRLLDRRGLTH